MTDISPGVFFKNVWFHPAFMRPRHRIFHPPCVLAFFAAYSVKVYSWGWDVIAISRTV